MCTINKSAHTKKVWYERIYLLLDFSSSTRGERDTILTMQTILSDPTNVRRILWCLRSPSVEIRKTQLHLQRAKSNSQLNSRELNHLPPWKKTQLSASMVQCQPSTLWFSKSSNSPPISFGHDVIHTPASFPVWGFIMTMVIVISFANEHKLYPMSMHLNS